jgi:hypothetical protein
MHSALGIENNLKKTLARVVVSRITTGFTMNCSTTKFGHHFVKFQTNFQQYEERDSFKKIIPVPVYYF